MSQPAQALRNLLGNRRLHGLNMLLDVLEVFVQRIVLPRNPLRAHAVRQRRPNVPTRSSIVANETNLPVPIAGGLAGKNGLAALLHRLPLPLDYAFILARNCRIWRFWSSMSAGCAWGMGELS